MTVWPCLNLQCEGDRSSDAGTTTARSGRCVAEVYQRRCMLMGVRRARRPRVDPWMTFGCPHGCFHVEHVADPEADRRVSAPSRPGCFLPFPIVAEMRRNGHSTISKATCLERGRHGTWIWVRAGG